MYNTGATVRRAATAVCLSTLLLACTTQTMQPTQQPLSLSVVKQFAPTGKLRAAINFGNPILANQNAATGKASGVSVDLATELSRRLGLPLELVIFNAAGKVVDAIKAGQVDVAFVAIDPVRGADIDYSKPYVVIEGAYMVRNDSPIKDNAEVDKPGTSVVVGLGSAYDLYLTREIKQASLVRAPTSGAVTDVFMAQKLDVAAGVKQQLQMDAQRVPGLRLLDGRFMVINQAMGMPKGRDDAVAYLRSFVEDMKTSGFVAQALARHKIEGAAVAP